MNEAITPFEIAALILSFASVLCIALSGSNETAGQSEEVDDSNSSKLIGSVLILCVAWVYASVVIITRKMQAIHFVCVMFYFGLVAAPAVLVVILGQAWASDGPIKMSQYDASAFGFIALLATLAFLSNNALTIAMQSERSGFVTMLGYIGLVYAFFGDIFIFHESFAGLELVGVILILVINLSLVWSRW